MIGSKIKIHKHLNVVMNNYNGNILDFNYLYLT